MRQPRAVLPDDAGRRRRHGAVRGLPRGPRGDAGGRRPGGVPARPAPRDPGEGRGVTGRTVVTFRAERAEDCLARFAEWAGGAVDAEDLGTLDGHRRYRVDEALWTAYTRATAPKRAR